VCPQKGVRLVPYYYFEAVTADGHLRKKFLKARDKKDADKQIRSSGLHPILIEGARFAQKKKQEKQVGTRRILQRTILFVASISLVVGIAAYLIMLDLSSVERFDVRALSRAGIISQTSSMINAKTQEERDFAREMWSMWDQSFPDSIAGIEIKHKGLMLVNVKFTHQRFDDDTLGAMAEMLNRAFHRRFQTSNSKVLIVHENETLAESTIQGDEVRTIVY
jgi:hypothetical protein